MGVGESWSGCSYRNRIKPSHLSLQGRAQITLEHCRGVLEQQRRNAKVAVSLSERVESQSTSTHMDAQLYTSSLPLSHTQTFTHFMGSQGGGSGKEPAYQCRR